VRVNAGLSDEDSQQGKLKFEASLRTKKVKLFRVTVSASRTEFVATNDLTQSDTDAVQDVYLAGRLRSFTESQSS